MNKTDLKIGGKVWIVDEQHQLCIHIKDLLERLNE